MPNCNSPASWSTFHVNDLAVQLEKSAQRQALRNWNDHIMAFDHALNAVRANSSVKQAGCDEFFTCTHHVFPHFVRVPFLVEECGSLLLGNGASMFVGQSQTDEEV